MRTIPGASAILAAFIVFFVLVSGCTKTSIQYGQEYIDNGVTNIILVDSISPIVSTIYKDSVATSQSGNLLVGTYTDPYMGKPSSNAYFQLSTTTLADVLNNAQYDSLVLLMKCNGQYYGDTTLPISLSLNQLTQEIKLPENQFSFYNINSFPINSTPLGTRTVTLRPLTGDSANIRLSDAKGQELFNLIRTKDNILKDNILFTDYIKGMNLSSLSTNNAYGFKDSVIMRLYYHQTDVFPQYKYFDFAFSNQALQFNHISLDRSGTPLAPLNSINNELFSTSTNNIGYLMPAAGMYLKIGFPYIRKLLERVDYEKIIKAQLIVKPIANSYNGLYSLPRVLNANQTDGADEPGNALVSAANGSSATETGNLNIDLLYGVNTNYSYDVTSYLQQEINIALINKDGLLLLPPAGSRYSSFDRLVIGDVFNLKNKLQLNLYYISVNK